jgi:hypothetical protein
MSLNQTPYMHKNKEKCCCNVVVHSMVQKKIDKRKEKVVRKSKTLE